LLRVTALARQALTDTVREDVLRFARVGSTLRSISTSNTWSVVGCRCVDVCHDSTDPTASGFVAAADDGNTGAGLRGVTSLTSVG
jgi:hypothetical protein